MQKYFINNKSDELILIFNGWGMDEKPFLPLVDTSDVLIISDYTVLEENLIKEFDFSQYKKISLIAFSAGVMMTNYFSEILPKIDYAVCVNGTFKTFDYELGVTAELQQEMRSLTMDNALEFRTKLITDESQLALFNRNQPLRTLESSLDELRALETYKTDNKFKFDKILISTDDKIMKPENQLRFWNGHENIQNITGGHFPFYNFLNFSALLGM